MKALSNNPYKKNQLRTINRKLPPQKDSMRSSPDRERKISPKKNEKKNITRNRAGYKPNLYMNPTQVSSCTDGECSTLKSQYLSATEHKASAYSSLMLIIEQMKTVLQIGIQSPTTFLNKDVIYRSPLYIEDLDKEKRLSEFSTEISDIEKHVIYLTSQMKISEDQKESDLGGIDFHIRSSFERRICVYEELLNSIKETFAQIIFISLKLKSDKSDKLRHKNKTATMRCNSLNSQLVRFYRAPFRHGTVGAKIYRTNSSCSVNDEAKGAIIVYLNLKKLTAVGKFHEKSIRNDKEYSMASTGEELRSGIVLPVSNIRSAEILSLQKFQKCYREITTNYTLSESVEVKEENEPRYEEEEATDSHSPSKKSSSKDQFEVYEIKITTILENDDPCFIKARNYLYRVMKAKLIVK